MGMHLAFVAARTNVAHLREAFLRAWPQYELAATAGHLENANAMEAWKDLHQQEVMVADWSRDNPGRMVFMFWRDGSWATFMDEEYTHATDHDALKRLSAEVGTVMAVVVESASGSAHFSYCENGQLRRAIDNSDTDVTTDGEPLLQESGIDISKYYMDESEALWLAFGLSPFDALPTSHDCQAICVIDRTDYSDLLKPVRDKSLSAKTAAAQSVPSAATTPRKRWWQFW
jgi:hypothetical protein